MTEASKKIVIAVVVLVVLAGIGLGVAKKKLAATSSKYDGDYTLTRWSLDEGALEATGTMKVGARMFLIELQSSEGRTGQIYHFRDLSPTTVETETETRREKMVWECTVAGDTLTMQGELKGHVMKYEWKKNRP